MALKADGDKQEKKRKAEEEMMHKVEDKTLTVNSIKEIQYKNISVPFCIVSRQSSYQEHTDISMPHLTFVLCPVSLKLELAPVSIH